MSAARTSAVLGRRMCAVLAAGSAALHTILLGHATTPVAGALMAAMIIACLYCAYDLWVWGTLRAWVIVGLMNLAMIALHLPAPGHHHGTAAAAGDPSTVMRLATLLAVVEVVLAAAVLYYRTRSRTVSGTPVR